MPDIRRRLPLCLLLGALLMLSLAGPAAAHRRAAFPTQSLGSAGIDVVALQHLLRAAGQGVAVDAVFGRTTQDAVAAFQRRSGLTVDGIAGTTTWSRLVPVVAAGSRGEAVTAVQKLLNRKRAADLVLSGVFDTPTHGAVRAFQRHMGLEGTGAVDRPTWKNLLWHYALPTFGGGRLCNYNGGNAGADWGTGTAVGVLEAAATALAEGTGIRMAIGDVSWEHGGGIVLHSTHERGLDVDIALVRRDRRQCNRPGISYKASQYDRNATRQLIRALYEAAPGHIKLIYFNDPVLIGEGLVQRYPLHDDHLHVRLCEVGDAEARYRCPAPAFAAAASEAPEPEPPLPSLHQPVRFNMYEVGPV